MLKVNITQLVYGISYIPFIDITQYKSLSCATLGCQVSMVYFTLIHFSPSNLVYIVQQWVDGIHTS
jgi:hypothetical protein